MNEALNVINERLSELLKKEKTKYNQQSYEINAHIYVSLVDGTKHQISFDDLMNVYNEKVKLQ